MSALEAPLKALGLWKTSEFRSFVMCITRNWEFPKIRGTLFGGPYNKDPTISGSPIFGNSQLGMDRVCIFVGCSSAILEKGHGRSVMRASVLLKHSGDCAAQVLMQKGFRKA